MGYKKIHALITILGALAATIISFFRRDDLFTFGLLVVLSIVIFYILGSIIRAYLNVKFPPPVEEEEEEAVSEDGDLADIEDEGEGEGENPEDYGAESGESTNHENIERDESEMTDDEQAF